MSPIPVLFQNVGIAIHRLRPLGASNFIAGRAYAMTFCNSTVMSGRSLRSKLDVSRETNALSAQKNASFPATQLAEMRVYTDTPYDHASVSKSYVECRSSKLNFTTKYPHMLYDNAGPSPSTFNVAGVLGNLYLLCVHCFAPNLAPHRPPP